jgi:hypothetical protein
MTKNMGQGLIAGVVDTGEQLRSLVLLTSVINIHS